MSQNDETARGILNSKLLIIQSKRLMLVLAERRLEETGLESMRRRVDKLRAETEVAQYNYRAAMLSYGSPEYVDYWIVAYSRLAEMGHILARKMRDAVVDLPAVERYQASADVEMLEEMVGRWSASMRVAMTKSVA
jgi:hypothetical protein